MAEEKKTNIENETKETSSKSIEGSKSAKPRKSAGNRKGGKKKTPLKLHRKTVAMNPGAARGRSLVLSAVLALVFWLVIEYFLLVPINLYSTGFWVMAFFVLLLFAIVYNVSVYQRGADRDAAGRKHISCRVSLAAPPVILLLFIILMIVSSELFHAKSYASILEVTDAEFDTDLAETLNTDAIALMDTSSAEKLGDREIGSLTDVVSQYDVSADYVQIDRDGSPLKVSALVYAGFFKWLENRGEGIPGYVTVDPVSMSAEYVRLEEGMIYVPSAYFLQDANRYIRIHYPTALLDNAHFEIDEEGNPYYICTVYKRTIGLFGGRTVAGAILLDPVTGELTRYGVDEVPGWIDLVYSGDLLCTQYNWYGTLSGGFLNSVFTMKGCKQITTYDVAEDDTSDAVPACDYGYVAQGGDIWIYTGVTSVNSDSSNVGFLLANERTGEARFYSIAGADEQSAMDAAEGEVQEKGYQASFPSLINVEGSPTYIMVLKDSSGLVKLYAAVNVEQYNLVTTASTQEECIRKYKSLLGLEDISDETENLEVLEADITLAAVRYITVDGNTWIYLVAEDGSVYRALAAENEAMLILEAGDSVHLEFYSDGEIVSCEMTP